MSSGEARDNILKKIRMALATPTPVPFPDISTAANHLPEAETDLVVGFAETFTQLQGKFIFCINHAELQEQFNKLCIQYQWTKLYCHEEEWRSLIPAAMLSDDLAGCDASVTSCEMLVARTGSIILSSAQQGRLSSVYAPIHICIAHTTQLVYDISDGFIQLQEKYGPQLPSLLTFATGPSRTADIEKTLVVGVHGPKEVYCFVVEDK